MDFSLLCGVSFILCPGFPQCKLSCDLVFTMKPFRMTCIRCDKISGSPPHYNQWFDYKIHYSPTLVRSRLRSVRALVSPATCSMPTRLPEFVTDSDIPPQAAGRHWSLTHSCCTSSSWTEPALRVGPWCMFAHVACCVCTTSRCWRFSGCCSDCCSCCCRL